MGANILIELERRRPGNQAANHRRELDEVQTDDVAFCAGKSPYLAVQIVRERCGELVGRQISESVSHAPYKHGAQEVRPLRPAADRLLDRQLGVRGRQSHHETGASFGRALEPHRAAVRVRYGLHDRQAEAAS